MSQPTNGKSAYMVNVAEPANADGALVFTLVPSRRKELESDRQLGCAPQYMVRVQREPGGWALRWSDASDDPGEARAEIEAEVQTRMQERTAWIGRVAALVQEVEQWARELGWSTRRIEKKLEDPRVGRHQVPALLFQEDTCRVLLEPVGRSAPGAQGVVDLYLMPAYDDIASLYYDGSGWNLRYVRPSTPAIHDAESTPLTKESLERVLSEMRQHAI